MAISKQQKAHNETEFRQRLRPFTVDESAIKALNFYIRPDNGITRGGMYLLNVINNLIQTNGKNLYQRIPPEALGGCPEGGRRNVQASALLRAKAGTGEASMGGIQPSGYTGEEEIIGNWAERDGCWSDTPETNLTDRGMVNVPNQDGSEARVFFDETNRVYKTIDNSHYGTLQKLLDRITLHNATFPQMAMRIEGFGLREDSIGNEGYVIIISQNHAQGRQPTKEEIKKWMASIDYHPTENGRYYVSKYDNIVIWDINDKNCLMSKGGELLVYDCDVRLKDFDADKLPITEVKTAGLLPTAKDDSPWKELLGENAAKASAETKSRILKQLRIYGETRNPYDNKIIRFLEPVKEERIIDGRTYTFYNSEKVQTAAARAFEPANIYEIPPLAYDEGRVNLIKKEIDRNLPLEMPVEEFIWDQKYTGTAAVPRGGAYERNLLVTQLKQHGHVDGLVNGNYIVQVNPLDPTKVLISTPAQIRFMLFTQGNENEYGFQLDEDTAEKLASGKTVRRGNKEYRFNLDKGRIDSASCIKLRFTEQIEKDLKAYVRRGGPQ